MTTPIFYIYYAKTGKTYSIAADSVEDAVIVFLQILFGNKYREKSVTVSDVKSYNLMIKSNIGVTYYYKLS